MMKSTKHIWNLTQLPKVFIPNTIRSKLSYGYLSFEGNDKLSLRRQKKRRGKERARIEK